MGLALQIAAYLGVLFVCFGSWALPQLFWNRTVGVVATIVVDVLLIAFWFRYGF